MSTCDEIHKQMHEYLDGSLNQPLPPQLETHLSACEDCRQHFRELGAVAYALTHIEWKKSPANFTEQLIQRVEYEYPAQRQWQRKFMRWTGVAASIVMLIGLGVTLARPSHFSVVADHPKELVYQDNQVIIPQGKTYTGNLVIQNGDIIVEGQVDGNVTALNGKIIRTASADISGESKEINQFLDWIQYYWKELWRQLSGK